MSRRIYRVRARPLIDSLRALYAHGVRLPALTVSDVRVSLDPSSGRLYVRHGERPLGEIHVSGIYKAHEDTTAVMRAAVTNLIEQPTEAAKLVAGIYREAGIQPKCAICRIPLGTKTDRIRGIGAKCWDKGDFGKFEKRTTVVRPRSSKIETRRKKRRRTK